MAERKIFSNLETYRQKISEEEITKYIHDKAKEEIAKQKFIDGLTDIFSRTEGEQGFAEYRVADIVTNASVYGEIRKLRGTLPEGQFDTVNDYRQLRAGMFGYLWGSRIW